MNDDKKRASTDTDKNSFVEDNQKASTENAAVGEREIKKYDDVNPDHKAFDDIPEVQSTDDV